jgi:hypothetical protein
MRLAAALLTLTVPVVLAAQAPVTAPADMAKLNFLIGEWRGEGWMVGQAGRQTFTQGERVLRLSDGHVIVVEGLGKNAAGVTIHQAFAVISYDAATAKFAMRTFRAADGTWRDNALAVSERGFVWGFPTPQGQVRFTMNLTDAGQWHEIGEFSMDGATWRQFLDFTLTKQP